MEMHQVRYFLAVVDELNVTRAADRCHVSQPSLTRAIKLLEEEFASGKPDGPLVPNPASACEPPCPVVNRYCT